MNPALALIAVSGSEDPRDGKGTEAFLREVGGPIGLVGRTIGLGTEEMQAGIPWWAWALGGFALGAAVMYVAEPEIRAAIGRNTV